MADVLFLTQVLPYPLDSGAKKRQYHMLRHLARDHQVTLVSFVRPDDPDGALDHLRSICRAAHGVPMQRSTWRNLRAGAKGMLTGLPIVIVRDEIEEMERTLSALVSDTDYALIHADQLSMAGYGQMARRMAAPHRPQTLLDEHNAFYRLTQRMAKTESRPLRRALMTREARAFARYETSMCEAYDAIFTVIPEDREHLLALFPPESRGALAPKFTVIPICVDPDAVPRVSPQHHHPPTVIHIGTMFWPPNSDGVLWFAEKVLPRIHREIPDTRFVVIGKNPPPEVERLAADPRVEVTGYVEDLTPHLASADLFIVPVHAGSGMRVKILDAWMWGVPVVSTPIGAEGIEIREDENILIAPDAQSFAAASLRLLRDRALNQRLREQGRAWVEERYAWQHVYDQVDRVYEKLLSRSVSG